MINKKEYLKTLRDVRGYRRGLKDGVTDLAPGRQRKSVCGLLFAVIRYAGQCENLKAFFELEMGMWGWDILHRV